MKFKNVFIKLKDKFLEIIFFFLNDELKFNIIYKFGYWKTFKKDSFSGSGSNLKATKSLRQKLPLVFKNLKIKTIFDVPCGDWNWFRYLNLSNINYTGGDIVNKMIDKNNNMFKKKNIRFINHNLLKNKILKKYDLVFVRDCFVHLTDTQVLISLKKIINSECKYLATTSYIYNKKYNIKNPDRWRPINLLKKPFCFPKPFLIISDKSNNTIYDKYKYLFIWKIKDLKKMKI